MTDRELASLDPAWIGWTIVEGRLYGPGIRNGYTPDALLSLGWLCTTYRREAQDLRRALDRARRPPLRTAYRAARGARRRDDRALRLRARARRGRAGRAATPA